MQRLVFNTTLKTVKLYSKNESASGVIFYYDNIPTVQVMANYYEVYENDSDGKKVPVLRIPICGTNMKIVK